ncbi:unnamed protein product, partial [Durusdinium trenchii]
TVDRGSNRLCSAVAIGSSRGSLRFARRIAAMIKLRVEAPWKPEELPHETEDEGPRPADVHGDVGRPADGPGGCEEAPHDEQAPIFRG